MERAFEALLISKTKQHCSDEAARVACIDRPGRSFVIRAKSECSIDVLVLLSFDLGLGEKSLHEAVEVEILRQVLGELHSVLGGEASGGDSLGKHVADLVLSVLINVGHPVEAGGAHLGETVENLVGVLLVERVVKVHSDLTNLCEGIVGIVVDLWVNLGEKVGAIVENLGAPFDNLVLRQRVEDVGVLDNGFGLDGGGEGGDGSEAESGAHSVSVCDFCRQKINYNLAIRTAPISINQSTISNQNFKSTPWGFGVLGFWGFGFRV